MQPDQVQALFTRRDGAYLFARWGRALAPVVFGVEDATLRVFKSAFDTVIAAAGHEMAAADPELGANVMVFFCREWEELTQVPDLDKLIPELGGLVPRLVQAGANQYRMFRFDPAGAIKAAFVFLRMDADLVATPAEVIALAQAVQVILLWSNRNFRAESALTLAEGRPALRPEIAGLLRAAYHPVMPAVARDASHALRLAARVAR